MIVHISSKGTLNRQKHLTPLQDKNQIHSPRAPSAEELMFSDGVSHLNLLGNTALEAKMNNDHQKLTEMFAPMLVPTARRGDLG